MREYPLSAAGDSIRPLTAPGHFYPRERGNFSSRMAELRAENRPDKPLNGAAALVPLGAIEYTGGALAWALQQLPIASATGILLLARVHREEERTIWLPDYSGFQTLFDTLRVPTYKIERIAAMGGIFRPGRIPFEEEPCFDLVINALGELQFAGEILPILFGSSSNVLIPPGLDLLEEIGPDYVPIICDNLSKDPKGEMILSDRGNIFFKLLETHFHRIPDRWYHEASRQYCAALWSESGRRAAGDTQA